VLDLGALYGRLTLDATQWNAGMASAQSSISTLTSVATAASAAIGAALGAAAAYGVSVAASMETTQIAFETLLGSAEAAGSYVEQLRDDAAATPFEFAGLSASAQRLVGMGLNAEQARLTTLALGDAVAAVGGGTPELQRASTAFGQMAAKGKTSMEELQQLAENNIPAVRYLAEGMGVSVAEAMAKVSAGGVSAAEGMKAIMAGIVANSAGAMEKQSATLTGRLSTLKDDVGNVLGEAFAPLRDVLSQLLAPLTTVATTAVDAMQPLIDGATEAARYVGALLAAFSALSPGVRAFAMQAAVVGLALAAAAGAMGTFSAGVGAAAAPIAQTASVLGSLGSAASGAVAVISGAGPVLSTLWSGLANVGAILTGLVPRVLAWISAQFASATASATAAASTAALATAEVAEGTAAVAAAGGTSLFAAAVAVLETLLGPMLIAIGAAGVAMVGFAFILAEVASAISIFNAAYQNNLFGIADATDAAVDGAIVAFGALGEFVADVFGDVVDFVGSSMMDLLGMAVTTAQAMAPIFAKMGLGDVGAGIANALAEVQARAVLNQASGAGGAAAIGSAISDAVSNSAAATAFSDFISGVQGATAEIPDYTHALDGLASSAAAAGKGIKDQGSVLYGAGYVNPEAEAYATAMEKLQYLPDPGAEVEDWFELMSIRMKSASNAMGSGIDEGSAALDDALAELTKMVDQYAAFWSGLRSKAIGSLGDAGSIAQSAIEGGAAAGPAGAIAAGALAALSSSETFGVLVDTLNATVANLVTALDPVIVGLAGILMPALSIVGTLLNALAPVFDVIGQVLMGLAPVLMVVGAALGVVSTLFSVLDAILTPIMPILDAAFRVLFEVLSTLAKIILNVFLTVAGVWNALVGAISGIVAKLSAVFGGALDGLVERLDGLAVDTTGAADALATLNDMTYDSAYEQANLAANAATTADTMEDVTEALTNVPSGYKVAMARFEAMAAEVSSAMSGVATSVGGTTGGERTRAGTTGGRRSRTRGGGNTYHLTVSKATLSAFSVSDLAESAAATVDKRTKVLTGSPAKAAGRWVGRRK